MTQPARRVNHRTTEIRGRAASLLEDNKYQSGRSRFSTVSPGAENTGIKQKHGLFLVNFKEPWGIFECLSRSETSSPITSKKGSSRESERKSEAASQRGAVRFFF
jgi:hypothetical protein